VLLGRVFQRRRAATRALARRAARLLPRAARTVSVNKDVSIVQLLDIRVNTEAGTDGKIDVKFPDGLRTLVHART
jgi:hypothetical protein